MKKKVIVGVLIMVLIVPLFLQVAMMIGKESQATELSEIPFEELDKAKNLANESGVAIEDIIQMRKQGVNWNDIIERVSKNKLSGEFDDNNISETDIVKILLDRGFTIEEIEGVQNHIQWIMYKIEEINTLGDFIEYKELAGQINSDDALYYTLILKESSGSIYSAFDEYLAAIQLNIDIVLLEIDKEEYTVLKQEKLIINGTIITTSDIESKIIETLNNFSGKQEESAASSDEKNKRPLVPEPKSEISVFTNKTDAVNPINPTDKIKEEVENLVPNLD